MSGRGAMGGLGGGFALAGNRPENSLDAHGVVCTTCGAETQPVVVAGRTLDRCPWTTSRSVAPATGTLWACTSPRSEMYA